REIVDESSEKLRPWLGLDLRDVLFPEEAAPAQAAARLRHTALTQPALFVVEYALARLWQHWGIEPVACIGHSIGEYVAACLAGVFSLDDALRVVATRGQLMDAQPPGAMLSVPLPECDVAPLLGDELSLAAVNGPSLCAVSGPEPALAELEAKLEAQELSPRRLHTSHAFHSAMMDPAVEPFTECVRSVALRPPAIPFVSNPSGTWITDEQATDPAYWGSHLRQTVRFGDGVRVLVDKLGPGAFLEVGPGNILTTLLRQQVRGREGVAVVWSLRHPREEGSDLQTLTRALGRLWAHGVEVDSFAYHAGQRRRRVELPTYPFQRRRYWIERRAGQPTAAKKSDLADWIYVPSWKRSMSPAPPETTTGRWLVFADDCGLAENVRERLEAGGGRVALVRAGEGFAQQDGGRFTVSPTRRDDYDSLVRTLRSSDDLPDAVVYLWGVTGGAAAGITSPLRIACVTDAAQDVTGEERVCPGKAAMLSACRVIPQEYENFSCRAIDIPLAGRGRVDDRQVEQLVAELASTAAGVPIAYRSGHRWVQSFEPARLEEPSAGAVPLREQGVYLITGGLGGIGLALAGHLAGAVRARLVLTGRSAFPQREHWQSWLASHGDDDPIGQRISAVQALERAGAEVMVAQADVSNEAQMRQVIADAVARFGAVHGVIHSAGVPGGGVIQLMTPASAELALSAKVTGTRVRVAGQAGYCAANAYQDAFARAHPLGPGTRVISVNWDTWRDVGMAVETELPDQLRYRREEALRYAMSPAKGVEVFRRILARATEPQIVVSTRDLAPRLTAQALRPEDAERDEARGEAERTSDTGERHPRPELDTPYVAPGNPLEEAITDIWRELLGIDRIGVHDNFFELGGHSLLATQLLSRLRSTLLVDMSMESVFEASTVAGLAELATGHESTRGRGEQIARLMERMRQMSTEERESLLAKARQAGRSRP
ncbi:MAG: SDR family NAD(P)-dependent oxidoreductase, partial [Planctomycetota bacterium]